jgi:hypothetical protein
VAGSGLVAESIHGSAEEKQVLLYSAVGSESVLTGPGTARPIAAKVLAAGVRNRDELAANLRLARGHADFLSSYVSIDTRPCLPGAGHGHRPIVTEWTR